MIRLPQNTRKKRLEHYFEACLSTDVPIVYATDDLSRSLRSVAEQRRRIGASVRILICDVLASNYRAMGATSHPIQPFCIVIYG